MPKILTVQLVGAYAQTELGHGSNVRGLRTTATFDPETDEWVLETPTLTSMKFWPSNLGRSATHCTLYAQLITRGKAHGVHVFWLQV